MISKKGEVIKLGGVGTNLFVGDDVVPTQPLIDTDDEKSSDEESESFNFLQRPCDGKSETVTSFYSSKQKGADESSQNSDEVTQELLSKWQTRSRSRHDSRKRDLAQRKHKGPCAEGCDCTTSRDQPLRRELKMLQQYAGQDPMERGKTLFPWFSAIVLALTAVDQVGTRMCPTITLIIFVVTMWINLCEYLPVLAFQLTPVDSEDVQVLDSIRQLSSDSEYAMKRAAAEIEEDDREN